MRIDGVEISSVAGLPYRQRADERRVAGDCRSAESAEALVKGGVDAVGEGGELVEADAIARGSFPQAGAVEVQVYSVITAPPGNAAQVIQRWQPVAGAAKWELDDDCGKRLGDGLEL